jgi:uncharacterized membrane protein YdjX (TVP38/TMEM64 family)
VSKVLLRVILFSLLSIGIVLAIIYRDAIDILAIQSWVEQSGALAPLVFMLIYVLATVFFIPGAIAYTYLGYIGREAATGGEGLIQKVLFALALLAIIAFLLRLINQYRNASQKNMMAVCRTDRKSSQAAQILSSNGFNNVHIAKMGMTDWIKKGFSTT